MKMFEILELQNLYNSISDTKLPLKTTYKFARLMKRAEEEIGFYKTNFQKIIEEFGQKDEAGDYKMSEDGMSIVIIPGRESECNERVFELRNLEVPIDDIKFFIDELEKLDVSITELSCLMSLIED